ncbi:lipopolysaccharide biosynthesis protein [Sphingomonas sp. F9_3S_D5_B_2]
MGIHETSEATAELQVAALDEQLKRRTGRSIFWTMGQAAGDQLFSFAVFVMLARVLDKSAIGTFAIAFVFMDIGRNLATAGVSQRIARAKTLTPTELDTIFWTNMFLAAAYSAVIIIAAPAAERIFGAPQLAATLVWLTIPIILSAGGNTHMALRLREFGHRTLAVRSVLGGLIGGSCAVIAALMGYGIWALVLQRIVRELVCTVLAWTAYRWRPGFDFDRAEGARYLRNTVDLGFAQVVTLLSLRAQDLGVARVLGPAVLSSYRVAWRCAELIGPQIVGPFATVALQTFSRLQDHAAELRTAYLSMLQQCALVSVPALVGYAVAGPWLVPALFGPQWHDAGAIAPMLLPLALPYTVNGFVLAVLAAQGQISWQRYLSLLDLASTVLVTVLTVSHGLKWLALAYSIRAVLLIPLQVQLVRRATGIGFRDHARALVGPTVAAGAMGVLTAALFYAVDPRRLLVIVGMCGVAAIAYGAIAAVILPDARKTFLKLVASGRERFAKDAG